MKFGTFIVDYFLQKNKNRMSKLILPWLAFIWSDTEIGDKSPSKKNLTKEHRVASHNPNWLFIEKLAMDQISVARNRMQMRNW